MSHARLQDERQPTPLGSRLFLEGHGSVCQTGPVPVRPASSFFSAASFHDFPFLHLRSRSAQVLSPATCEVIRISSTIRPVQSPKTLAFRCITWASLPVTRYSDGMGSMWPLKVGRQQAQSLRLASIPLRHDRSKDGPGRREHQTRKEDGESLRERRKEGPLMQNAVQPGDRKLREGTENRHSMPVSSLLPRADLISLTFRPIIGSDPFHRRIQTAGSLGLGTSRDKW